MFQKSPRVKLSRTELNKVRVYVFERDGKCLGCGTQLVPQLAHVRGKGANGNDSPNNLVRLCGPRLGIVGCHAEFDAYRLELPNEVYEMLKKEPLRLGE